jgi:hypothetical protein
MGIFETFSFPEEEKIEKVDEPGEKNNSQKNKNILTMNDRETEIMPDKE